MTENSETVFIVMTCSGCWGRAHTLSGAAAAALKAGARKSDVVAAWVYHCNTSLVLLATGTTLISEIFVDGAGNVNYPPYALSTQLFAPSDSNITLRNLLP